MALATLKNFALVYGDDQLMIAQETMSALPVHWRLLPEVSDRGQSEEQVRESVDKLSDRHRKLLHTLAASGGFGLTRDAAPDARAGRWTDGAMMWSSSSPKRRVDSAAPRRSSEKLSFGVSSATTTVTVVDIGARVSSG